MNEHIIYRTIVDFYTAITKKNPINNVTSTRFGFTQENLNRKFVYMKYYIRGFLL